MSDVAHGNHDTSRASHGHSDHGHHDHGGYHNTFIGKYIFSFDHKVIGLQFLFSSLFWLMVGGALALGVRWQLAFPWQNVPLVGPYLFRSEGGQMSPEFYTMLFTMHASVMIFLVIIPFLLGAFANYLIPLQIGYKDMAFPTLNMLSYWFMWPGFICFVLSFLQEGGVHRLVGLLIQLCRYCAHLIRLLRKVLRHLFRRRSRLLVAWRYLRWYQLDDGFSQLHDDHHQLPSTRYDLLPHASFGLVDFHHGDPASVCTSGAHRCWFHAVDGSNLRYQLLHHRRSVRQRCIHRRTGWSANPLAALVLVLLASCGLHYVAASDGYGFRSVVDQQS